MSADRKNTHKIHINSYLWARGQPALVVCPSVHLAGFLWPVPSHPSVEHLDCLLFLPAILGALDEDVVDVRAVVESEDEVAVTEHEADEGAVVETAEVYVVGVPDS